MEDFEEPAAFPSDQTSRSTTPRRGGRRRFRRAGIALALMLPLGAGAFLGASLATSEAQAAPVASGGVAYRLTPTVEPGTPGTPGACDGELTVSQVTSKTITVTRPDGSTATIHIGSRTHYTENGHTVTVSAVKVGSKIYVVGTCANGGRNITAASIQIVG